MIHLLIIKVDVKRGYVVLNIWYASIMIHFKSVGWCRRQGIVYWELLEEAQLTDIQFRRTIYERPRCP